MGGALGSTGRPSTAPGTPCTHTAAVVSERVTLAGSSSVLLPFCGAMLLHLVGILTNAWPALPATDVASNSRQGACGLMVARIRFHSFTNQAEIAQELLLAWLLANACLFRTRCSLLKTIGCSGCSQPSPVCALLQTAFFKLRWFVTLCIAGDVLRDFTAADTPGDALVMAWLVGDLSQLVDLPEEQQAASQAQIEQKWARHGAERITIRKISDSNTYGASFCAGHTTYLVFSWNNPNNGSSTVPYQVGS